MSGVAWSDLVTLNGKGQRGVLVRRMPGDKLGVRRSNGTMFEADRGVAMRVLDRSYFRPGDIVASELDPGGQVGVRHGSFRGARPGPLRPRRTTTAGPGRCHVAFVVAAITGLVLGDYVVSGPWLGRVIEVSLDVDVAFDDGALCSLAAGAERKLVGEGAQAYEHDLQMNGRQTNSVLYPGQRVVAGSPSVFRRDASRWIRGYWKPSRVRGTVARVGLVHWLASMHLGTNKALIQASAPPAWQPSPLKKLALFPYPASEANVWYVGDRCFFRTRALPDPSCHESSQHHEHPIFGVVDDDDGEEEEEEEESSYVRRARGRQTTRSHVKRRPTIAKRKQQQAELERPMSVAGTRTTVDVLWQDGKHQCGVPSPSLLLFNRVRNDYDFFPGQHVISRSTAGKQAAAARSGVVRSLNCKDKTVCVSRFQGPAVEGETTVVSAYDVAPDPYANFFYGDVVVRLRHPAKDDSRHDLDLDLSWIGHIVDLCCEDGDGHIQVKWGDGNTCKVLPREIAVVRPQKITEMLKELGDWLFDNRDMDGEKKPEVSTAAVAQEPIAPPITGGDTDSAGGNAEGDDDSSDGESDSEDSPGVTTRTTMDQVRSVARALIRLAGDAFSLRKCNRRAAMAKESAAGSESPAAAMEGVVEASTSTTSEMKAGDAFFEDQ